jgi:DNA repair protein RecO (recombination protein O)
MVGLARHLGFFPGNEWAPGHWFDIREGLFTPVQPAHGALFSRENAALLGALMDIAVGVPAAARASTTASAPKEDHTAQNKPHSDSTPSAVTPSADLAASLAALPLNRTRRVDFLNAMLAYFGYHLDATRDIRSVDILREVF